MSKALAIRKRAKRMRVAAAVAVLIVAVSAVVGLTTRKSKSTDVSYTTEAAVKDTLIVTVAGSGSTVITKDADVVPSVSGTVKDLRVAVGDKVSAGQVLFTIENDQDESTLARSLASLRQAEESVAQAKLQRLQAQQTVDSLDDTRPPNQPAVTEAEKELAYERLTVAKAGVRTAQANLTATRKSYYEAKEDAGDIEVKAPISGVVTDLNIEEGGSASGSASGASASGSSASAMNGGNTSASSSGSSGGSAALTISDLTALGARIQVNEADLARLKLGQKATLSFDAVEGLELTGKVKHVAPLGTDNQGVVTYDVDISLDVTDARVKPGMSVSAAIVIEVKQDVVVVPNAAVKSDTDSSYVQVLGDDGKPQQVVVTAGASNDSYTEISEGLEVGDKVVTATLGQDAKTSNTGGFGMMMGGGRPTGERRVINGGPR